MKKVIVLLFCALCLAHAASVDPKPVAKRTEENPKVAAEREVPAQVREIPADKTKDAIPTAKSKDDIPAVQAQGETPTGQPKKETPATPAKGESPAVLEKEETPAALDKKVTPVAQEHHGNVTKEIQQRRDELYQAFTDLYTYGVSQFEPVAKYFLRHLSLTCRGILNDTDLLAVGPTTSRDSVQAVVDDISSFVQSVDSALAATPDTFYEKAKLVFIQEFPWRKQNISRDVHDHIQAIRRKHAEVPQFVASLDEQCRMAYANFVGRLEGFVSLLTDEERQRSSDLMQWYANFKDVNTPLLRAQYFWRFLNWCEHLTGLGEIMHESGEKVEQ